MTQSAVSQNPATQLQQCLSLARDVSKHGKANEEFTQLRDRLAATNPQSAELVELLWNEVLASRRSAIFWQEVCDVEKELTERIAANNQQLKQNLSALTGGMASVA